MQGGGHRGGVGQPVPSATVPKDLQEGTKFCCLVSATVNKKENEHGRRSFLGGSYRRAGTRVVQEGRGGYGAHTVKNWCAGRARGTQGRDRSEGRAKGRKWWTRRKTKKQKKPVEKKKKKKIFGPSTSDENRPPSPTKRTLRV